MIDKLGMIVVAVLIVGGVNVNLASAEIIIGYQIYGTTAHDPQLIGWTIEPMAPLPGSNVSVGPVNDPVAVQGAAWNLSDQSTGLNISYRHVLSPNSSSQTQEQGWWLSARARYLTDYGGGPGMGLRAYMAGKAYKVLLDLDNQGDLRATLPGVSQAMLLTQDGTGTDAYHTYDLFADPQSREVTFRFDGQDLAVWDGVNSTAGHADLVRWGIETPTNRGSMNFDKITFSTGLPPILSASDYNLDGRVDQDDLALWSANLGVVQANGLGDGNQDGKVDGADFLLWQQELSTSFDSSVSVVVPEPPTGLLLNLVMVGLILGRVLS